MNAPVGQINVSIVFRYVLILEWLDEDDLRTGEALHRVLAELKMPSRLVRCTSADDVRAALADALANMGERGIPAVHLETHAEARGDCAMNLSRAPPFYSVSLGCRIRRGGRSPAASSRERAYRQGASTRWWTANWSPTGARSRCFSLLDDSSHT